MTGSRAALAYDAMAGVPTGCGTGTGRSSGETCCKMRGLGNFAALASNSVGTLGRDPVVALAKQSPNWLVDAGLLMLRHARAADDGWLNACCCDRVVVESAGKILACWLAASALSLGVGLSLLPDGV